MQKTTNYQLPQWEASDPIKREDFNEAMESIDTGLAALSTDVASAGGYVIGNYTGDGNSTSWRSFTLGFKPRFLIITGQCNGILDSEDILRFALVGEGSYFGLVFLTDTGFEVFNSTTAYPHLNEKDWPYSYIAFR